MKTETVHDRLYVVDGGNFGFAAAVSTKRRTHLLQLARAADVHVNDRTQNGGLKTGAKHLLLFCCLVIDGRIKKTAQHGHVAVPRTPDRF